MCLITHFIKVFYLIHQLVFLNALIQNRNHIYTIAFKRIDLFRSVLRKPLQASKAYLQALS